MSQMHTYADLAENLVDRISRFKLGNTFIAECQKCRTDYSSQSERRRNTWAEKHEREHDK